MRKRKLEAVECGQDITDSAKMPPNRWADVVIDLADSPPVTTDTGEHMAFSRLTCMRRTHYCFKRVAGRSEQGAGRVEVVDLADSPSSEQRHKIMAQANSVNAAKQSTAASAEMHPASKSQFNIGSHKGMQNVQTSADSSAEHAKQAIMQHAAQLAPGNLLLAQLHAERLARHQLANPQHQNNGSGKGAVQKPAHPEPLSQFSLLTYNVW